MSCESDGGDYFVELNSGWLVKKINLIRDIVPVIMANFWKVDYFLLLKNIQTIARSLG